MKIKTNIKDTKTVYKALQDYLIYRKSEKDIIAHSTQIILTENAKTKTGETQEIQGIKIIGTYPKMKTQTIYKAYMEGRPIAGGAELLVKNGKIYIYEKENEEKTDDLKLPENIINEVMTDKEIEEKYEVNAKQFKHDISEIKETEKHEYKNTMLLTKNAIVTLYKKEKIKIETEINPLLFILTTQEAGYIWNKDPQEVRASAIGSGHRNARLVEGKDCRKSGKTWLITTEAMYRLFGMPDTQKIKKYYERFANKAMKKRNRKNHK